MNLRRVLILSHRYLGIAISLMFVIWFASGITMIYAGDMPRLSPQVRLERLPALDLSKVRLDPEHAAQRFAPGRMVLTTVLGRPAYRIEEQRTQTIFADTGEFVTDIDLDTSRQVASRFVGVPPGKLQFVETIEAPDQWTLARDDEMPMHRFRLNDPAGSEIYVSAVTAEVALLTTRNQRLLAWIGTIPHWIYFASLRTNQSLWYETVVWLSELGCVLAVLGLVLGFTQFRRVRPFRLAAAIPYRDWMRWHYILGAVFGIFALTWVFSGLLSMEPFAWTNARGLEIERDVLTGGEPRLANFATLDASTVERLAPARIVKEIAFVRIQDDEYYALSTTAATPVAAVHAERRHQPYEVDGRGESDRILVEARTLAVRTEPFSTESIVKRLAAAVPDRIVEQTLLTEYDSYYYSRGRQSPLPVLRVKFDDPAQSWFYVNLANSEIVAEVHEFSRLERWLYNGLHSLDFKFWYSRRPLWDMGMIVLLLGGLALSCIGLYLGITRMVRDLKHAATASNQGARTG